jgi:hypothetical protein
MEPQAGELLQRRGKIIETELYIHRRFIADSSLPSLIEGRDKAMVISA